MSWPQFKLRALLARQHELQLAGEQALAVWDGEQISRLMDETDFEVNQFLG